jgi:hypothetical protein
MSTESWVRERVRLRSAPPLANDLRDLPLFSSGLLSSIEFLQLVLEVETTVGPLEDLDITLENFDSLRAIAGFIAERTARGRAS